MSHFLSQNIKKPKNGKLYKKIIKPQIPAKQWTFLRFSDFVVGTTGLVANEVPRNSGARACSHMAER